MNREWDEYTEDAREAIDRAMLATSHVERLKLWERARQSLLAAARATEEMARREHESVIEEIVT